MTNIDSSISLEVGKRKFVRVFNATKMGLEHEAAALEKVGLTGHAVLSRMQEDITRSGLLYPRPPGETMWIMVLEVEA